MTDTNDSTAVAVLQERVTAMGQRLTDALESRDRALGVALSSMDNRLAGMNEFRATLSDQATRYVTRIELGSLNDKIELINRQLDRNEGGTSQRREARTNTGATIGIAVGISSGLVGFLALVLAVVVFLSRPVPSSVAPTVVSPAVIPVQPK